MRTGLTETRKYVNSFLRARPPVYKIANASNGKLSRERIGDINRYDDYDVTLPPLLILTK